MGAGLQMVSVLCLCSPQELGAGWLWAHGEQLSTLWLSSIGPVMPLLREIRDMSRCLASPFISPHFCTSTPFQSKAAKGMGCIGALGTLKPTQVFAFHKAQC